MCLSGSFFGHFPKSSSLIYAILFRVFEFVLCPSCCTTGVFFSPGSCRAARLGDFPARGVVVLHDRLFFCSGELSCGTTACFFLQACFRAARQQIYAKFHQIVRHFRGNLAELLLIFGRRLADECSFRHIAAIRIMRLFPRRNCIYRGLLHLGI